MIFHLTEEKMKKCGSCDKALALIDGGPTCQYNHPI